MDRLRTYAARLRPALTISFTGLIGCFLGGTLGTIAVPEEQWCEAWGFMGAFYILAGGLVGYVLGATLAVHWHNSRTEPGAADDRIRMGSRALGLVVFIGLIATWFVPFIPSLLGLRSCG